MKPWTPPHIVALPPGSSADLKLFECLNVRISNAPADDAWVLARTADRLILKKPDGVQLTVDFTAGKAHHRMQESGFGAQTLSKALGLSQYYRKQARWPLILDANGGLGQDAWAIASTGCHVCVIEKNPLIHALLDDALKRASASQSTQAIASRITLVQADSTAYMQEKKPAVHAIYLDPMYPPRHRKKAKSKKAAQFLGALAGPASPDDSLALLHQALLMQAERVVVKRPDKAPRLEGSEQFSGQITSVSSANTRYDIYHRINRSQN